MLNTILRAPQRAAFRRHRRRRPRALALSLLGALLIALIPTVSVVAQAATVSGTVYQDFNGNGTRDLTNTTPAADPSFQANLAGDAGIGAVIVRAYSAAGSLLTQTTTASDGSYSLNLSAAGPYRIEFTNLPVGYEPAAQGSTNNTTVQFVPGAATAVNLGVNHPSDFCQDNPTLVTSCYQFGNQTAANVAGMPDSRTNATIRSFPYNAGSLAPAATAPYDLPAVGTVVQAQQVGPTWGIAYGREARAIFASAFMKRHTGFGPSGLGAIYKINRDTNAVIATYTLATASTNAHTAANAFITDNGNTAFDAVGKTSLGGLAITDDGARLYAVNLEDRTIYQLDPAAAATTIVNSAAIATAGIPLATLGVGLPGQRTVCQAGDVRPFAIESYRGNLYLGLICSAESSATIDTFTDGSNNCPINSAYDVAFGSGGGRCNGESFVDNDGNGAFNLGDTRELQAFIYQVDPTTLQINPASPLLRFPLNYPRGFSTADVSVGINTVIPGHWNPWVATYQKIPPGLFATPVKNGNYNFPVYPQPWLVDIEFDGAGAMLIGLRDRYSDQVGNGAFSNPSDPGRAYYGIGAGDMLRACLVAGSWALESNASCGSATGSGVGNNQGPGAGEFYAQDDLMPTHQDLSLGGMLQIPGYPDSVNAAIDPIRIDTPDAYFDVGFRWNSNTNGAMTRGYRVQNGTISGPQATVLATFGKAGGLGDLLALCDAAPVEIGNRVWFDRNADGRQDPDEPPIPGVRVELVNSSGTVIAFAITDASGRYYFSNDARRGSSTSAIYGISTLISNQQYAVRIPLSQSSLDNRFVTRQNGDSTTDGDIRDSDGDNPFAPAGSTVAAGVFTSTTFTVGGPGRNNHTYDFGFTISPTAVVLTELHATRDGSTTTIGWATAAELSTLGYQIYRSDDGSWDRARRITSALIPATGRGQGGASYRWADLGDPPAALTRYWLVEVELGGATSRYGPIGISPGNAAQPYRIFIPDIGR